MFGRIYKLTTRHTNSVYVGSTEQPLEARMRGHKNGYIKYLRTGAGFVSSYDIMRWPDVVITLIEEAEFADLCAMRKREGEVIAQTAHTVNKRREHGKSRAALGDYEYYVWYRFNNPEAYRVAAQKFRDKKIAQGGLLGRCVACERCGRRHRLSHQRIHDTKWHQAAEVRDDAHEVAA